MNKLFIKFLLLVSCFFTTWVHGQMLVSPITITLPNNPPANIADWSTAMPPVMILAQGKMQNGMVNGTVQESRILVTIKSGGNKVCGSYTPQTAPLGNFNTPTKNWSGANAVSLLGQSCVLKPGSYELCVQFYAPGSSQANLILIGENCKPFTIKENTKESYNPPQNIAPSNEKKLTDKEAKTPLLFRWTPIVPKPQTPVTYKLRVWQLMQGQTATAAIKGNRPVVEREVKNQTQFVKPNLMGDIEMLNGTANLVWRVSATGEQNESFGESEPTAFMVNSNSDYTLGIKVTKLECVKVENGNNIYNVCITSDYQSNTKNLTFNNAGSGINVTNISYTPAYTVSAITPALVAQNSGSASTKNYCFTLAVPVSQTSVIIGILGDDINPNPSVTTQPFADTIVTLPSCACTACDNIKIDVTGNPTPSQNGNNVKFTQSISVSALPSNAPINIKTISAEILYVDIKKDDEQCYRCDKNADHYGKFVNAICSNQFFKPNNGIAPIPATGEIIFKPVLPPNSPNNGSSLTNANLSFEIAAPDLNRCCKDTVTVCIKYTIVTADCKTCSVTKCYTLPRQN